MTKEQLIQALAEQNKTSKALARRFLASFENLLTETLDATGECSLPGFGRIKAVQRSARVCRNPATGERVDVPAQNRVKFKPYKSLAARVKAAPSR